MTSKTGKLMMWLIIAVFAAFSIYEVYNYLYGGYKTETAYTYEVSNSVLTKGVMLRYEKQLDISVSGGVTVYSVQEGSKIKNGSPVAQVYSTQQDAQAAQTASHISAEYDMLVGIKNTITSATVSDVEDMAGNIRDTVRGISRAAAYGRLDTVYEDKLALEELFNRRCSITGEDSALDGRIAELRGQTSAGVDYSTVTSNAAGYFSRSVDGYEGQLTPDIIDDADSAQITSLSNADYPYDYTAFGKVVSDYHWYYATVVSAQDAELFYEGAVVRLTFEGGSGDEISAKVYRITEEPENQCAIIYMSGETVNADTISRRKISALVSFIAKKGVRFPAKALRIVDGVKGVYVDNGYSVGFKKVEIIYTGKDFYISKLGGDVSVSGEYLANFDKIIVGGTDLYDGKPLLTREY